MSDIQNYEDLANAIIQQAAKDYLHALRTVKRRKNAKEALREALEIEAFFHSPWYRMLTQIDPDYQIKRLRQEAVK